MSHLKNSKVYRDSGIGEDGTPRRRAPGAAGTNPTGDAMDPSEDNIPAATGADLPEDPTDPGEDDIPAGAETDPPEEPSLPDGYDLPTIQIHRAKRGREPSEDEESSSSEDSLVSASSTVGNMAAISPQATASISLPLFSGLPKGQVYDHEGQRLPETSTVDEWSEQVDQLAAGARWKDRTTVASWSKIGRAHV